MAISTQNRNLSASVIAIFLALREAMLRAEFDSNAQIVAIYMSALAPVRLQLMELERKALIFSRSGLPASSVGQMIERDGNSIADLLGSALSGAAEVSADLVRNAESGQAMRASQGTTEALSRIADIDARALRAIMRQFKPGGALQEYFAQISQNAVKLAKDRFAQSVVNGFNPRRIGHLLAADIEQLSVRSAMTLSRTFQLDAFRTSQLESYRAIPNFIEGWYWLASLSERTCLICIALNGTFHDLSEPFISHPNCRCTSVPALKFGAAPPPETGEAWLARQSPRTQLAIFGSSSRMELWQRGVKLSDMLDMKEYKTFGQVRTLRPLGNFARN